MIVLEGGPLPVLVLKGLNAKTGRSIDLSKQSLTFVSSVIVGALVTNNTSLSDLNVNTNDMGPEGLTAIVDQLKTTPLKTLDISSNVRVLGDKELKTMSMDSLKRYLAQQKEQLNLLFESMGALSGLEKLSVDKNMIEEISSIGKMLSLKTLSISGNKLATLPEDLCQLRFLKKLSVHNNRIYELHASLGLLVNLETLDLRSNLLTYLPVSIGQLNSLKHLDVAENRLGALVLSVCNLKNLERIDVRDNPLQRPPLSLAKQGIAAIRRYFQELVKSGETTANTARLVLLGHGESGKTSLQRGLRAGAPRPAGKDERTIQLDIYSMAVGDSTKENGHVLVSMWDLAGQPQYAAGLQPYIVPGSLYLMTVPANPVDWLDSEYSNVLGRWMDYLTTGAPDAVVQFVLTHCDQLVPDDVKDRSHEAFAHAALKQIDWIKKGVERHQSALDVKKRTLRVQDKVMCVSSVAGGDQSLSSLRLQIESLLLAKPPLLPSVGQTIPRTWVLAMTYLRALRDGRDPIEAAKVVGIDQRQVKKDSTEATPAAGESTHGGGGGGGGGGGIGGIGGGEWDAENREIGSRAYMTVRSAKQLWVNEVAAKMGLAGDAAVLDDALQLLVNQGEIFASCGIIYLQPNYVVRLLKPLVDHRLNRQFFTKGHAGALLIGDDQQRAATLLPAIDCLVKSGELREELLPLMWDSLGLERDDYAEVLLMMSVSGVLFLAEHTQQGRRWVMPMRLPPNQPTDAMWKWNEAMGHADGDARETLAMSYRIGSIAPPGIPERLTASCYGFGKYHRFWKCGALIETRTKESALLLLELRVGEKTTAHEKALKKGEYELCMEMRGKKSNRHEHWAILLQIKAIADAIIHDFPGLTAVAELSCPGCAKHADHRGLPTRWACTELHGRPMVCPLCQEQMVLMQVDREASVAAAPKSLNDLMFDASSINDHTSVENKYLAEKIRFGRPIEGLSALHKLLGLQTEDELKAKMLGGEGAIIDEIETACASATEPDTDEYGWTHRDWLNYVRTHRSGDFSRLPSLPEDSGKLKPASRIDLGNRGLSLDDFLALPAAASAGLKRAHVLALRLYSSSVFRSINRPLHDGCSPERPHPYPALVALLTEAIKKLRAAETAKANARPAEAAAAAAAAAAAVAAAPEDETTVGAKSTPQRVLWRGMCNLDVASEFKQRGGTELSPMSMSMDRAVSVKGVLADVAARMKLNPEAPLMPLLLKVRVDSAAHMGADVHPFSVYPDELEYVYPPCTYLEPRSEKEETVYGPSMQKITVKIIEVVPQVVMSAPSEQEKDLKKSQKT